MLVLADPPEATALLERFAAHRAEGSGPETTIDLSKLLPAVQLFVHLYAGDDSDRLARVEGAGPVTVAWVKRHLGQHAKFTIRPVLDLAGQAPVDAYEIPERHRRAVQLMTPADIFPFSREHQPLPPDRPHQAVPARPAGSITGRQLWADDHHPPQDQAFGGWEVKQPFEGIYVWRDPHGAYFLVDHTGTRRLPAQRSTRRPADKLELYFSDLVLDRAA